MDLRHTWREVLRQIERCRLILGEIIGEARPLDHVVGRLGTIDRDTLAV